MAKEVRLPQLGQTMEEGTIVNCLVKVGDEVKKGDVIFEIETDKATLEMESPADGFVKLILVKTDETLPIGEPLLVLGGKNEDVPQSFVDSLKGEVSAASDTTQTAPAAVEPAKVEPEPVKSAGKIMVSPRAKKLAADLGVDLAPDRREKSPNRISKLPPTQNRHRLLRQRFPKQISNSARRSP